MTDEERAMVERLIAEKFPADKVYPRWSAGHFLQRLQHRINIGCTEPLDAYTRRRLYAIGRQVFGTGVRI